MYEVTPFMSKLQTITTKIILSTDTDVDKAAYPISTIHNTT